MLDAERTSQFESISNQTFNAIPGIMFAGTIYAVVLTIGTAVFLLVSSEVVSFERFVTSDSLVETNKRVCSSILLRFSWPSSLSQGVLQLQPCRRLSNKMI